MTTVATTSWPMLTRPRTPPHCMNVESWSTSLVTRETREPRRSPCWCSTERSWTWRNARTRSPASAGLRRPEEAHVHPVHRDRRDDHDERAHQDQSGDQVEVRSAGGRQPSVDHLLDGDGHNHPAGGG